MHEKPGAARDFNPLYRERLFALIDGVLETGLSKSGCSDQKFNLGAPPVRRRGAFAWARPFDF